MIKSILIMLSLIFITTISLASSFKMSTSTSDISFGEMDIGEWKQLGEGSYYTQITCKSTNGKTWYLKTYVLTPLTSGARTIDNSYFKYMPGWTDGTGTIQNQYTFNAFTTTPTLVYLSGGGDNNGNDIHIQFQYGLSIPAHQVAGPYNTTVRYLMTETL